MLGRRADVDGGGITGVQVPGLQAGVADVAEHVDLRGFRQVQAQAGPVAGDIDFRRAGGVVQLQRHAGGGGGGKGKIIVRAGIVIRTVIIIGAVRQGDFRARRRAEAAAVTGGYGQRTRAGGIQNKRTVHGDAPGAGIQAQHRRIERLHARIGAGSGSVTAEGNGIARPQIGRRRRRVIKLERLLYVERAVGIVHLIEENVVRRVSVPGARDQAQNDGLGRLADIGAGVGGGFQSGSERAQLACDVAGHCAGHGRTGQQGAGAIGQQEISGDLMAGNHRDIARAVSAAFRGPRTIGARRAGGEILRGAHIVAGDQGYIAARAGGKSAQHRWIGSRSVIAESIIRIGLAHRPESGVHITVQGPGKNIAAAGGIDRAGSQLDALPGPQINVAGGGLDGAAPRARIAAVQINIADAGRDIAGTEIVARLQRHRPIVGVGDFGITAENYVLARQQRQVAGGFTRAGGQIPIQPGAQSNIAAGLQGDLGEIFVQERRVHVYVPTGRGIGRAVYGTAGIGFGASGGGAGSGQRDVDGVEQQLSRRGAANSRAVHARRERQYIRRTDFDIPAVTARRAASGDDLTAGRVAENIIRLDNDISAGTAAGGSITASEQLRVWPEVHRVGSHQFDHAVPVLNGVRLQDAILIDHLGLYGNRTAIGRDAAEIVHRTRRHFDGGTQAAAIGRIAHEHFLARRQINAAAGGAESALVLDILGDEIERFARADTDLAVVHDARQWRHAGELPARAGSEILRLRSGGGDETAAHGHKGIRPKIKAVGIRQDHRAVGGEIAEYLRGARAADQIQHHGILRGLEEPRGLAGPNVKALPVQHGGGTDIDGQLRAKWLEARAPGTDAQAGGIGLYVSRPANGQQQGGQPIWGMMINNTFHWVALLKLIADAEVGARLAEMGCGRVMQRPG